MSACLAAVLAQLAWRKAQAEAVKGPENKLPPLVGGGGAEATTEDTRDASNQQ